MYKSVKLDIEILINKGTAITTWPVRISGLVFWGDCVDFREYGGDRGGGRQLPDRKETERLKRAELRGLFVTVSFICKAPVCRAAVVCVYMYVWEMNR